MSNPPVKFTPVPAAPPVANRAALIASRLYLTPEEAATWDRIKGDARQSDIFKRRIFRRRGENPIVAEHMIDSNRLEFGDLEVKAKAGKKTSWFLRFFDSV